MGQPGHKRRSSTSAPASPHMNVDSKPSSPASSVCGSEDGSEGGKGHRVPGFAVPMQSGLLKRISSYRTKEELLEFVASYHMLLDPINLVTCLYRLAKMSFSQRSRNAYLTELQRSPTFQLLLRSISAQFLHAQLMYMQHHVEPRGVDSRCLANLVWALAKLDLSCDDTALSTEIAVNVAPFVLRNLEGSSPQGLANMLWSYAKLPVAPPEVIVALVSKITSELRLSMRPGPSEGRKPFDAQALSNSIWALAHRKSRGMEVDAFGDVAMAFLEAVALSATRMLMRLQQQLLALPRPAGAGGVLDAAQLLTAAEADFSCQALVNICWALATIAGNVCATHPPFRQLFTVVHAESIGRLRATAALLRARQPLPYHGVGGFNEQALSNAVYAFDKAGLLQHDLLSAIFEVAVLRLQLGGGGGGGGGSHDGGAGLSFKPQELCTLLKACHTGVAPPWAFLSTLLHVLAQHPAAVDNWSAVEKAELQRAYMLYRQHQEDQNKAAESEVLARLQFLEAAQIVNAAAAAAVTQQQQQQQAVAAAVAALERRQQAMQQQQQVLSAIAGAQQVGAPQRIAVGAGAAARPPPVPFAQSAQQALLGGRQVLPFASGPMTLGLQHPMGLSAPFSAPFSAAQFDPVLSSGGSNTPGVSPRTPQVGEGQQMQVPMPKPSALPANVDHHFNRQERARLAHVPPQEQMMLFAQTQQRLACDGLATSTAGNLWDGNLPMGAQAAAALSAASLPAASLPAAAPVTPMLQPAAPADAAALQQQQQPWAAQAQHFAANGAAGVPPGVWF